MFLSQRTLGWKISYEKLMKYFKGECEKVKCFIYAGIDKITLGILEIVELASRCGTIILSDDSDFVAPLDRTKKRGKRVKEFTLYGFIFWFNKTKLKTT